MRGMSKNRGVSMVEVLVSIVLASIALLALAGVNAASVRYAQMSQFRGTAVLLANDIAERMRANKAGFVAGNYQFNATEYADQLSTAPVAPAKTCDTTADTCSAAEMAAADLYSWQTIVRDRLPDSATFIANDPTAAHNGADVYVIWRDPSVANADESPTIASECPAGLSIGSQVGVRCVFYRVQL